MKEEEIKEEKRFKQSSYVDDEDNKHYKSVDRNSSKRHLDSASPAKTDLYSPSTRVATEENPPSH